MTLFSSLKLEEGVMTIGKLLTFCMQLFVMYIKRYKQDFEIFVDKGHPIVHGAWFAIFQQTSAI